MSLHDAIKQIHPIPPLGANINQHLSFKEGHKQARHAAAELAIASDARIKELEAALAFYADPTRYWGPNQSLDSPDAWSEHVGLQAYRMDVTRDQGDIARNALKGQP